MKRYPIQTKRVYQTTCSHRKGLGLHSTGLYPSSLIVNRKVASFKPLLLVVNSGCITGG